MNPPNKLKRQGQIVAAMLNNFEAVEDSLNTMKDSAGSAMSEMGIIEESLEYKLNSLKETGVGVFQNLFQSDSMKIVLDVLSGILGFVDGLTEKFGLLGTAMLAVPIVAFIKNFGCSNRSITLPRGVNWSIMGKIYHNGEKINSIR